MNKNEKLFVLMFGVIFIVVGGIASFAVTDDGSRSGKEIFSDVQQTYNSSDSISVVAEVSVESRDQALSFNLDVAAKGDRYRINVSGEDTYRTIGTDGNNIWVFDPRTDLTGVIESSEERNITISVRAGTDEDLPARIPSIIQDQISENTTVNQLRQQFGDRLPEELEDVDGNTTISELTEEFNSSVIQDAEDEFGSSEIDALPNSSEFEKSVNDVVSLFGSLDIFYTVASDVIKSNSNIINTSRTEVTKIGSTQINGEDASELLINYSSDNIQQRLYVSTDDDTLLKQNITLEDSSITIQYNKTILNVQVAPSTFEPTGITEIIERNLYLKNLES